MINAEKIIDKTKDHYEAFRGLIETFEPKEDSDTVLGKIISSVSLVDELFKHLNYLIVFGSYILYERRVSELLEYIKEANNSLHSIISDKNELSPISQIVDESEESQISDNGMYHLVILQDVITSLNQVLYLYNSFQPRVQKIIEGKCDVSLFEDESSESFYSIEESDFFEIAKWLELFRLNCQIALLDHGLFVDHSTLNRLLKYRSKLVEIYKEDLLLTGILLDKVEFLIFKIKEKLNKDSRRYTYTLGFRESEINSIGSELKYFNRLKIRFTEHYGSGVNLNGKLDEIYAKAKSDYSFQDYHDLIKHYKDEQNNIGRVSTLIKVFRAEYNQKVSKANCILTKRAWQINLNYLMNNELSILLKKEREFSEKVERQISDIISLQKETNVYNYFPFLKIVEFLKTLIGNALNSANIDFEKVGEYQRYYAQYLEKLYKNFEWCYNNRFGKFQIEMEECCCVVETRHGLMSVFLASSYISPINYNEVKNKMDELKMFYDSSSTILPLYKHIVLEKDEIKEIKNDLNSHDKKQIEILGIFAAIVLFTAGEIQLMTKISVANDLIVAGLSFAYAISTFVFLIHIITRDKPKVINTYQWVFGALYLLGTYSCLSFLLKFWPF